MDNKQKEQSRKRQQRYRDNQKRNAITAKRNENVTEAKLDECVTVTEAFAALSPDPVAAVALERMSNPADYQHQPHCNAPRFARPFTKGVSCSCRQVVIEQPKEQSHNPMMVGYVPPKG